MAVNSDMSNELRSMVRDVLRDVMADRTLPAGSTATESVRLSSDQDLAAFVARITDPAMAEKIRSGKLRFTLASPTSTSFPTSTSQVVSGVITEKNIDRLSPRGTLVLGPGAVLTPLARDKARRLGLKVERTR